MPLMHSLVEYTQLGKIFELGDMSIETSKTERQREKKTEKKKKLNRISKNCGTTTKGKHIQNGNMFERKRDRSSICYSID